MSLRRLLPTNRNAEAASTRSPLENTYTSNDTIQSSVPGRDSVMLPDETKSKLTDTLGDVVETSEVASPRYSKRPSHKFKFSVHFSCVWIC